MFEKILSKENAIVLNISLKLIPRGSFENKP